MTVEFHQEYSTSGTRRGINRNITFRNIRLFGRHKPRASFKGYDEKHKTRDVLIDNVYWNDCLLTELEQDKFVLGEFTENIRYEASEFSYKKA